MSHSSSVDIISTITNTLQDYYVFELRMWMDISGFDMRNLLIVPIFFLSDFVKFLLIIIMAFTLLITSYLAMNKFFPVEQMQPTPILSTPRRISNSPKVDDDGEGDEAGTSVWDMGEEDEKGNHINHKATQTVYKPYKPKT